MKTVAAFSKPFEAHMLIARLESNCITSFARDENMVTLDWLASNAIGGVKVDVADEDYERAVAIMNMPATATEARDGNVSQARVVEIERAFRRSVILFTIGALPLGILFYFITPAPDWGPNHRLDVPLPPDFRPIVSAVAGFLGGCLALVLGKRRTPSQPAAGS